MAIWTEDDVALITSYLDGLTINDKHEWRAAWPGDETSALHTADIDLASAIEDIDHDDSSDTEFSIKIVYRNSESFDEDGAETGFTTEEIIKTWPIATEK